MDRRNALKRLVAGGAAVAVASTVRTSPAFADGGSGASKPTGVPSAPTVSAVTDLWFGIIRRVTITLAVGAASCPKGSPTTARRDTYATTVNAGGWSVLSGIGTTYALNQSTFNVVVFDFSPTPPQTFTLQLNARWVCDNASGGAAWVCRSWNVPVTLTVANTVTVGTITTATVPATCNSPAPSPP